MTGANFSVAFYSYTSATIAYRTRTYQVSIGTKGFQSGQEDGDR